ncbi:MAG: tripartite tricarboxylate transporter substrate-binding protein [Reyranella sp.]
MQLLIWINTEESWIDVSLSFRRSRELTRVKTMWQRKGLSLGFVSMAIAACMSCLPQAAAQEARASDYPNRRITIMVPWTAGGPSDTVMRIMAGHMSRTLGQRLVVENHPGSSGTVASLRTKLATPDGYTLVVGNTGTHGSAVALYSKLPYDPRTDFEPIAVLASGAIVIVGRKDLPPTDLKEFVAYLQSSPYKLDEAHGGVASISFTACLLFDQMIHAKSRLVPYDGAMPSVQALVRGRVDYMCDQTLNVVPQVRTGRIKAYAIAAPVRNPALPDVPTTKEGGLPEYELSAWQALFAPKGTPKAIVEKLNDAVGRALDDDTVRGRLLELGADMPQGDQRTSQALADLVRNEVDRWTSVVKAAGPF